MLKASSKGLLEDGDRGNKKRKGLNEGITGMERGRRTRNLGVKKQQRGKGGDGGER